MRKRHPIVPVLRVGGVALPVYLDDTIDELGQYLPHPDQQLVLAPQDKTQMFGTLLHEALHVIEGNYGIKIKERDVLIFEAAIVALLIENPALVKGIVRSGKP